MVTSSGTGVHTVESQVIPIPCISPLEVFSRPCSRNISVLGAVTEGWSCMARGRERQCYLFGLKTWSIFQLLREGIPSVTQDRWREGEQPWEIRQNLNNLEMKSDNHLIVISDSNTISSFLRCPLCVYHCLDYCQDLLFRCWVSLCSQLSFLYNSAHLYGQGKPCSLRNPQPSSSGTSPLSPGTRKRPKVSLKCHFRPVTLSLFSPQCLGQEIHREFVSRPWWLHLALRSKQSFAPCRIDTKHAHAARN